MKTYSFKVNEVLNKLFDDAGLLLVDFKLEFGLFHGQIVLGDEFSRTAAVCGTRKPARRWTRTASARASAM